MRGGFERLNSVACYSLAAFVILVGGQHTENDEQL
jgi:hypothetical protein